jgi:hypothetical protein
LVIDAAQRLVEIVEGVGGRFELDLPNCQFIFEPGRAPKRIVHAVFRKKNGVMKALVARHLLEAWQPPEGTWVN